MVTRKTLPQRLAVRERKKGLLRGVGEGKGKLLSDGKEREQKTRRKRESSKNKNSPSIEKRISRDGLLAREGNMRKAGKV